MTENDRLVIYNLLSEKDYARLKTTLEKTYKTFLKAHESDLNAVIEAASKTTMQVFSNSETSKPEALKSGTAKALADSIKGVAVYEKAEKDLKKAEKAVDAAQKAFDKATADLLNAEQNYKNALGTKKEDKAEKKLSAAQEAVNKIEKELTEAKEVLVKAQSEFDAVKVQNV